VGVFHPKERRQKKANKTTKPRVKKEKQRERRKEKVGFATREILRCTQAPTNVKSNLVFMLQTTFLAV